MTIKTDIKVGKTEPAVTTKAEIPPKVEIQKTNIPEDAFLEDYRPCNWGLERIDEKLFNFKNSITGLQFTGTKEDLNKFLRS